MLKWISSIVLVLSVNAFAGVCSLDITREACPGKDSESYAKCDGKKQCVKDSTATSEKDCAKKALKECDNARLDITKNKTITAKFEGKPVEGGKNFCAADRPDFNKCK